MVESLEALHSLDGNEDRLFRVVIYSVNQKGRSPKVVLKDLLIGDRDHHSACKDFGFFYLIFSLRLSVCPSYFWVLFFHIKSDNCRKLIVFVLIKTEPLSHYINVHISLNVFYFICVVISAVESGAFPMSAIFSGISIVILFVLVFCVVSILWKRSQQHKADDVTDGSKQSSSLLCTSVVGNTNGTANANHTDTITKVSAFELS